ncbi:MAG: hypothetical protein QOH40_1189, partial [Arthrobacter pascens]|nr:hypothetical protein [Arthrobacter pascens]
FDISVPLPPQQALPYIFLTALAITALGVAALAVLQTS